MRLTVTDTILVTAISPEPLRPGQVVKLDAGDAAALLASRPTFFRAVDEPPRAPAPDVADAAPVKRRKAKA
jgi:hypothetical protein